jgi:hypothetical protein
LQHDAVSVHVFKCLPIFVPIWVVGLDGFITVPAHALDGALPFRFLRYVEDQKIVLGRRLADLVIMMMRKLKVVRKAFMPEHHAVKTIVVLKRSQNLQT